MQNIFNCCEILINLVFAIGITTSKFNLLVSLEVKYINMIGPCYTDNWFVKINLLPVTKNIENKWICVYLS